METVRIGSWVAGFLVLVHLGLAGEASSPRILQNFDRGWAFRLEDDPQRGARAAWRTVDLPHDWSIEDLPRVNQSALPVLSVTEGTWRFRFGDDPAWKLADFDDSGWDEVKLPASWRQHAGVAPENAFGWYRRKLAIPASMRGKDLVLLVGKVDDSDETFVNGVKVGATGSLPPHFETAWTVSRRYRVPASLLNRSGGDTIAVRVYNGSGDAGIYEAAAPPERSGPFDAESPSGAPQGYTFGGVGVYRKTFRLEKGWRGKRISVLFDGVYMNSTILCNGKVVGRHPYGYTSFETELTSAVRFDRPNELVVKVDASGHTSRWYSGSGIFRHVWLRATNLVQIATWGVSAHVAAATPAQSKVLVATTIVNRSSQAARLTLITHLVGPNGRIVATSIDALSARPSANSTVNLALSVVHPSLWSVDSPRLYHLVTRLLSNRIEVDRDEETIGLRTVSVSARTGLLVNGVPVKLRGGCMHHDNGCLGSKAIDRAEIRRVELLKRAGFNAIRTSHNPPSPAFLDACDRFGMLVIDEVFDCWAHGKNSDDYGKYFNLSWRRDVESMVKRDRNHPSVVFWSIGNEIPEQNSPEGANRAGMIADYLRSIDSTRPITQATNPDGEKIEGLAGHLDVIGYNYAYQRFAEDEVHHSGQVFMQTESFPTATFESWMAVMDHPYVLGDFVWTAMDYLGEAGLGHTHPQNPPPGYADKRIFTNANCGDIDLLGNMRPQCYYRRAVWNLDKKVSAFVTAFGVDGQPEKVDGWGYEDQRPSWTWPGMEGKPLPVHVYSACTMVRLYLNGVDLGAKPTNRATRFEAVWYVPYAPGVLTAVGLDAAGHKASEWVLWTAGLEHHLGLSPDRKTIAADGQDLAYIQVDILDRSDIVDPNSDAIVQFHVNGPGRIVGVCNADPRSVESFQAPRRKAWHGKCMVVIQSTGQPGRITVTAEASRLRAAQAVVDAR
jgi:beta-galactosidase